MAVKRKAKSGPQASGASAGGSPRGRLEVARRDGRIWSPIRGLWLAETPEERVRQEYLCTLVNEYGYDLEQIAEEVSVTGRGAGAARADFLIWRSAGERSEGKTAAIVVECKAENVQIDASTYRQGANYAQYERARFFVTHNNRETRFWRVDLGRRMPNYFEIANIPHAGSSDSEVAELLAKLKTFKEDEFADLLHKCHNIIRNREHLDPAAAFDEIAKILFVKMGVERRLRAGRSRENIFSESFLSEQALLHDDPINVLFEQTKREYRADRIVLSEERTVVAIVRELERYNLSDTSEDIKGIAFERFLGRTFRGEIGQFFTPRPIVDFMVRMMEPTEDLVVCDPASGSGGFLIRWFEIARQKILRDVDAAYAEFRQETEARADLDEDARAKLLRDRYAELQRELDQSLPDTRMWLLANRRIYGVDANERMARTSKMNMIMHGDGHGGVHHHNGFLNVNGIFEGRFDVILTNPPFGANVEQTDVVQPRDVEVDEETDSQHSRTYGAGYDAARERMRQAATARTPIAALFELGRRGRSVAKVKTELLFIERCLDLLKPGGRLGIVLPEGVFNNPSLGPVRAFVEDRARLLAVISLPQETFLSSGASVKASLLFLQKRTVAEQARFDAEAAGQLDSARRALQTETAAERSALASALEAARGRPRAGQARDARRALEEFDARLEERARREARAGLKRACDYPIFLYDAARVGITATGETDVNELFSEGEDDLTAYDHYRAFLESPESYLS
jgi:type I restriction enzyme M protein